MSCCGVASRNALPSCNGLWGHAITTLRNVTRDMGCCSEGDVTLEGRVDLRAADRAAEHMHICSHHFPKTLSNLH